MPKVSANVPPKFSRPVKLHVGIFGPSLSGKTTVARSLSRNYWERGGIRSIVLDKNGGRWGSWAFVTSDPAEFQSVIWAEQGCAVFADDISNPYFKRNGDNNALFTEIRHRYHKMHVMGHGGTNLLPEQRDQIEMLYLFRQSPKAATIWAEQFSRREILDSCDLDQYHFMKVSIWEGAEIVSLRDIESGKPA